MVEKITKLDLFPFFREFFNSTGDWKLIDDKVKLGHLFMLKRYLAIQFPEMIQMINNVYSARLVDSLHDMFASPNGQSPGWMYTKTKKKATDSKEMILKYSDFTIKEFKKYLEVDSRDFDWILHHHYDEAKAMLDSIEKVYDQKPKVKKK